jgi:hypothetical protein
MRFKFLIMLYRIGYMEVALLASLNHHAESMDALMRRPNP